MRLVTDAQAMHASEITAAVEESRQLSRFGEYRGAIELLEGVEQWCCYTTPLGSDALLELGMMYSASGRAEDASALFGRLMRSPVKRVRKVAEQMEFQKEAMAFLRVDERDSENEYAKLSQLRGVYTEKRYAQDAFLTLKPVSSLGEARMVLRSAAVRRSDAGAPQRIFQALALLEETPPEALLPKTIEGGGASEGGENLRMVRGEWLLGFIAQGGRLAFPAGSEQTFSERQILEQTSSDGGTHIKQAQRAAFGFERTMPGGGLLPATRTSGNAALISQKDGALALEMRGEQRTMGALPLPAATQTEQIVLLDRILMICKAAGGQITVWVRPNLEDASEQNNQL
jgi:hypothetical protein|tara:strand:+ start:28 stop:1059 length:1032 start_codon:yes stop_codon:yes gene_type:complete